MEEEIKDGRQFQKGHSTWQWTYSILANATLFCHGMECGWISPTTKILQSNESPTGFPLSNTMISWVASSMSMTAVFGVSLYSYLADTYGRKIGLIFIAIPQAISWIIRLSNSSITALIISRCLAGVASGGCFNIAPMYIKEISEDNIRGKLGTLPILMQNIGMLVMYLLGAYFDYSTVITAVSALPIIISILLARAPESPEFLVKNDKIDNARKTLALLRGLEKDDRIVQCIVENLQKEECFYKSLPRITLFGIMRDRNWRRGFILIMMLFFFHALNGAFAILTYASAILVSTGVEFDISPEVQTLSFPIILIIGSMSLAGVVEKFGRKPLLVGTFLISSLSMTTIAVIMVLQDQGKSLPSWLPVVAMMFSVAMLGAGVSPLPYIIMTEMFNFQVRAKVVGTVVTFAWFLSFVMITMYAPMANLAQWTPFTFYAVVNLGGALFTLIFIPETKGKSEEEIQRFLRCFTKITI